MHSQPTTCACHERHLQFPAVDTLCPISNAPSQGRDGPLRGKGVHDSHYSIRSHGDGFHTRVSIPLGAALLAHAERLQHAEFVRVGDFHHGAERDCAAERAHTRY